MSQKQLETKLISNSVAPQLAALIARFAHAADVDRHEKSWTFRGDLVNPETPAAKMGNKRVREKAVKLLSAMSEAFIAMDSGTGVERFPVFNSINLAYESGFVSYVFTSRFIEWAELKSYVSGSLH